MSRPSTRLQAHALEDRVGRGLADVDGRCRREETWAAPAPGVVEPVATSSPSATARQRPPVAQLSSGRQPAGTLDAELGPEGKPPSPPGRERSSTRSPRAKGRPTAPASALGRSLKPKRRGGSPGTASQSSGPWHRPRRLPPTSMASPQHPLRARGGSRRPRPCEEPEPRQLLDAAHEGASGTARARARATDGATQGLPAASLSGQPGPGPSTRTRSPSVRCPFVEDTVSISGQPLESRGGFEQDTRCSASAAITWTPGGEAVGEGQVMMRTATNREGRSPGGTLEEPQPRKVPAASVGPRARRSGRSGRRVL